MGSPDGSAHLLIKRKGDNGMWYFSWILGVGFAVMLAVLNAMWGENEWGRSHPDSDD